LTAQGAQIWPPKSGSHFLIPKREVVGQKREVVFEVSIMAPILRFVFKSFFTQIIIYIVYYVVSEPTMAMRRVVTEHISI
jgi:hypothetical protein